MSASPAFSTRIGAPCLMTMKPPGLIPAPPLCPPHPQDQGAFLCVVDDSNEHMLSVWDCSRGTKLAEIKVRNPRGQDRDGEVAEVLCREFQTYRWMTPLLPFCLGHVGQAALSSLSLGFFTCEVETILLSGGMMHLALGWLGIVLLGDQALEGRAVLGSQDSCRLAVSTHIGRTQVG